MPVTPEEEWTYWDDRATELRRGEMQTVQKAATAWGSLFGALVGVFGAVTLAGGLTTIDELQSPWDSFVKGATLAAITLALVTIYLAARAGGGLSPGLVRELDAASLEVRMSRAAERGIATLRWVKMTGTAVVVLLIAASFTVVLAGRQTQPAPTVIAVVNGKAICGRVAGGQHGRALTVNSTPLSKAVTTLNVVAACPQR